MIEVPPTQRVSAQRLAALLDDSRRRTWELTADLGGNQSYPSVEYTRTLDLSGFASLDASETYTLTIQARGEGFGHHKSLQALELTGDITPIPEPGSLALLGLGGLLIARRHR